jgi:hypothetical protein
MLSRETELARQMPSHQVAVEQRDFPVPALEQPHEKDIRDRRLSRTGQPGEKTP